MELNKIHCYYAVNINNDPLSLYHLRAIKLRHKTFLYSLRFTQMISFTFRVSVFYFSVCVTDSKTKTDTFFQ